MQLQRQQVARQGQAQALAKPIAAARIRTAARAPARLQLVEVAPVRLQVTDASRRLVAAASAAPAATPSAKLTPPGSKVDQVRLMLA